MPVTDTDTVPSHYDPVEVFAAVFDNGLVAGDLGPAMRCREVNALAAVLDAANRSEGAAYWLSAHRTDCETPYLH